jgi:geranylgeranyl pyrophosphate synthase
MDSIIVQTIIKGLEESKKSIESMQAKVQDIDVRLSVMETQQKTISSDVHQLLEIIRDGNGQEPIINRVLDLENSQKNSLKMAQQIGDNRSIYKDYIDYVISLKNV